MRVFRASEATWEASDGYSKRLRLGGLDLPFSYMQEVELKKGKGVPPHRHERQTEIFYFLSPGTLIVNGERLEMFAQDVIVCEPGDVHEVPPPPDPFTLLVIKVGHEGEDTIWL